MPIIGRADIDIRALTDKFRNDIQKAVKGIKDVGIDVKVSADISDAQDKINDLKKRSEVAPIEVNVRADTKKLEDSLKKATQKVRPVKVGVSANVTEFRKSVRELNDSVKNMKVKVPVFADPKFFKRDIDAFVRSSAFNKAKITITADAAQAQKVIDDLKTQLQNTPFELTLDNTQALATAQATAAAVGAMRPTMNAQANTKAAAAQLSYLARSRTVPFTVKLERDLLRSLGGMLETLSGILPEAEIRKSIQNVTANFSSMVLQAGKMGAAFSVMGTAGVAAFGGILAAGNDVARVIGIASALPAVMTMGYLAMKTWTGAWKNFGAAASGSVEALAQLTPSAQAAAKAMANVIEKIQPRVQESFWQQATVEMQEFARVSMPMVSNAMNDMAINAGSSFSKALEVLNEFGVVGEETGWNIADTLDNIGTGFAYMTEAMEPLMQSFVALAAVGSTYMPALGESVRSVARDFADFITEAARTGEVDRWIMSGVDSIKQLASITGSTVTIFGNMADAAERAGYGGIHSLAESLRNVAEASGDALVMEQMTSVFAGAARGAEDLGIGLGAVVKTLGRAAPMLGDFLELAGEIGRIGFENLDALLNAEGLGEGIMTALQGMKIGLSEAKVGFAAIGETIGNLATIAGTMFQTMAPGFNNLALLIRDVVESLTGGLTAAMPIVNHFVDMMMQMLRLPIAGLAEGVGALLTAFAALPAPLQNVLMATIAVSGAMKALGIVMATVGGSRIAGALTGLIGSLKKTGAAAAATGTTIKTAFATGGASAGIGAMAIGIGKLLKNFTLIGLAIGAVELVMGAYTDSVGAAESNTVALSSAVDQYGSASEEAGAATKNILENTKTFSQAAKDQITTLGGLLDGSNKAAEGFKTLGWDVDEMSSAIQKSGGQWTPYRQQLEDLGNSTDELGYVTEEASMKILGSTAAAGMHTSEIRGMKESYDVANRAIEQSSAAQEKAAESARKAAEFNRQVAEAVGNISPKLSAAADGYKVLGDAGSSASDKLSALQDTMAYVQSSYDLAGNAIAKSTTATQADTAAKMSNAAATETINQSIGQLSAQTNQLAVDYNMVGTSLLNAKGELDELNPVARGTFDNLSAVSKSIQEVGINTYDAALKGGASIETATNKAMTSMEPMIGNVKAQLSAMGIEGGEAMDIILRQIGLLPSDLRMSINAEGNAAKVAMETKLIVEGLVAGNYDIALGAVDKGAMEAIADAHGAGQAFAEDDYEAVFKAIAEDIGVTEAADFLQKTAGMDYEAIMSLYAENYASEDINKTLQEGGKLDGTKFTARLEAVNSIPDEVQKSIGQLQDLDDFEPQVQLEVIKNMFDQDVRDALAKALELENSDPETILSALDQASPTVLEALGLSEQFDGQVSTAALEAINNAGVEVAKAYDDLKKLDGSTHEARIEAVNEIPDEVQKALGEMLTIDGMDAEAVLHAMDNASPVIAEAIREFLKVNEVEGKGKLDADDQATDKARNAGLNIQANANAVGVGRVGVDGADDVVTKATAAGDAIRGVGGAVGQGALSVAGAEDVQAKAANAGTSITGFSLFKGTATLDANDQATPKIDPITGAVQTLDTASATPQLNLGGSPAQVKDDLYHIQLKLDDIGNKNPQPTITMQGGAQAVTELQNIVSRTSALSGMQATPRVIVSGADSAQAQISTVVGRISALSGMTAFPRIALSGSGAAIAQIGSVIGRMQALAAQTAAPRIILQGSAAAIAQIGSVIARMQALAATTAQPRIILQGGPAALAGIASVLSRLQHLGGSTAQPRIILQGGPAAISGIASVQRVFDALNRSVARPRIDMQGVSAASSGIRSVQNPLDHLSRTTATPNISLSGAGDANSQIDSVRSNLASLDGQVATTTVVTRRTETKADGGIMGSNGVAAFANGGIMKGIETFANGGLKMPNMSSFANGTENHVAQIAQGKWPVRVWAEPETGGEAYIPLHINKRGRSLEILNQVAEMFGFSLVKKFADGGILSSISASNGGAFADGGFHSTKSISGYVAGSRSRGPSMAEISTTSGSNESVVINNHVYPSAQLDERQVADSVARDLFFKLRNK